MQSASSRPDLARLRVLGASASAVVAVAGTPGLTSGAGRSADPAVGFVYVGLALLVVAWWQLGTLVHARRGVAVDLPELRRMLVWWTVPLLLCPPLFSRDVYSYLAQGAMVDAGIDIYQHGPASLSGPLTAEVPSIWQHAPAPYGPVFALYAAAITSLSGTNLALGVLGMRVAAMLGIALLAWTLPRLAERCGVAAASALWLGVLNPLVLLHGVAGAHNDAVMLGLLAAGLTVAAGAGMTSSRRPQAEPWLRLASGAALVTLAALVKVPAALGLVFLVPLWAAGRVTAPVKWRGGLLVAGVAGGCAWLVTSFAGTGFGWVSVLGTPVSVDNWSLTSTLGRLAAAVLGTDDALSLWRGAGLLTATVIGCGLWMRRDRFGPVRTLGLAFVTIVALGPAFRPWYLLWGVVPLAAAGLDERPRLWLAGSCAALTLVVLPDGFAPDLPAIGQAALGVAIGLTAVPVVRRLSQPNLQPVYQR